MPTLFGILLGYPGVYNVSGGRDGAARASRALSETPLTRVALRAQPPTALVVPRTAAAPTRIVPGAANGPDNDGYEEIAAFTVPTQLLQAGHDSNDCESNSHVSAFVRSWGAEVARHLKDSHTGWGEIDVRMTAVDPSCRISL